VVDFSHTAELISRARVATLGWLDSGGADTAQPERFLSLHDHVSRPATSERARPGFVGR
jgi:hypothetical protein